MGWRCASLAAMMAFAAVPSASAHINRRYAVSPVGEVDGVALALESSDVGLQSKPNRDIEGGGDGRVLEAASVGYAYGYSYGYSYSAQTQATYSSSAQTQATYYSSVQTTQAPHSSDSDSVQVPAADSYHETEVTAIKNVAVGRVMQRAPADYPKALQGIMWLDQTGFYGYSNFSLPAASLAVSLGCPQNEFNRDARVLIANITGPCWQFANNDQGYDNFEKARKDSYVYNFTWNADYSSASLLRCGSGDGSYACEDLGFTMDVQDPDPTHCPPPPGASKSDVSRCAKYVRKTKLFFGMLNLVYYGFEVIDNSGNPVEPYYSKFLEYANAQSKPDLEAAAKHHIVFRSTGEPGGGENTSFLGGLA